MQKQLEKVRKAVVEGEDLEAASLVEEALTAGFPLWRF